MRPSEVLKMFCDIIPQRYPEHMFCFFAANAAQGNVLPFAHGIIRALWRIDNAAPGYAEEMLKRMAAIKNTGEDQYEALIQIVSEIYVTVGAVESADRNADHSEMFAHEPGAARQKNPEFEACANGHWYANEVKTPKLIDFSRLRAKNFWQVNARHPREFFSHLAPTLPRDNPVKDFLVSANAKFDAYARHRPDAYRLLTIVWDDYIQEPVTALLHPQSGLLTDKSFNRDGQGKAVEYPFVDGVLLIRYQHQIVRATRVEPLMDGESPMVYQHQGFPPKVLIQNPKGRPLPDDLYEPLNAIPYDKYLGAEYHPGDIIMWVGADSSSAESPSSKESKPGQGEAKQE